MLIEREIDCGALYGRTRQALLDLVRAVPPAERTTTMVPASPAWSVQDVVAHVVGITADLRAGTFGPMAQDEWTARQVETRRGRSLDALADEWADEAPGFEDGLRLFGYEMGAHFVGDLVQHLSDVRHALDLPRLPDEDDAVVVALDFYLGSFDEGLLEAGVGQVQVSASGDTWRVGAGSEVATWTAGRFELLRSLGGRRAERQLRAQDWTGAVDAIVPLVSRYGTPAEGIVEG